MKDHSLPIIRFEAEKGSSQLKPERNKKGCICNFEENTVGQKKGFVLKEMYYILVTEWLISLSFVEKILLPEIIGDFDFGKFLNFKSFGCVCLRRIGVGAIFFYFIYFCCFGKKMPFSCICYA